MKKILTYLGILTAGIFAVNACQREDLESSKDNPAVTHTVNFIAGGPETKTSYEIDTQKKTVAYSWSDTDANDSETASKFTVYENGNKAGNVVATLNGGLMSISATFSGTAPTTPNYQAVFNSGVSSTQTSSGTTYDQNSDVLVSLPLTSTDGKDMKFSFKREVAMAKMTLTGLAKGTELKEVIITADKPLAGTYNKSSGSFTDDTSNAITITTDNAISAGAVDLYFVTLPVSEATVTVKAKTTDENSKEYTYQKTFKNVINFTKGDVMAFSVAMADFELPLFYESFNEANEEGGNDGNWSTTNLTIFKTGCDHDNKGWSINREYLAYQCARIGNGSGGGWIITPSITLDKTATIKFKAGSWDGEKTTLTLSIETGSGDLDKKTISLEEGKFVDYIVYASNIDNDQTKGVQLKFAGDKRFYIDEVQIYDGYPNEFSVNYSVTPNESGTFSESPSTAYPGETIKLAATPADGYMFGEIIVKDSNNQVIQLNDDNSFVMPAANVNVTAYFPQVVWQRVTSVDDILAEGTYIIGYEATANSGVIVPMQNSGTATTSVAGYMYSGNDNTKSSNGTITMSSVTNASNYEVTITRSTIVNGAINIKIGNNFLGNTNTQNNCKLFPSEAKTTAFTPTIGDNNVVTLTIGANETYKTLQYNKRSGNERFAVYGDTQSNLVLFKKTPATN